MKDAYNDAVFEDCAWLSGVKWTLDETASEGVVIEVTGAAVAFEPTAGGETRTAEVAAGTTAEGIKVLVGGVDATKGFKVAVEGTTASVVLREPYEAARPESAPYQAWTDNGDESVTLNVEVVSGLYYAADSAATIDALRRPGAAEPANWVQVSNSSGIAHAVRLVCAWLTGCARFWYNSRVLSVRV